MTQAPTVIPAGLEIPDTSALNTLQNHMQAMCVHFDWTSCSNDKTFMLFIEEVGELAKALRKREKLFHETGKPVEADQVLQQAVAEEFADIFAYLLDLASRYGVDLGQAYHQKMTANFSRSWK